mmetsp:Transcript_7654/g.13544  ORF Transcript_7654/g.13544 Transcript_7654/m.13544 type:complete len:150 (+) Transcript_7654:30-479(+)
MPRTPGSRPPGTRPMDRMNDGAAKGFVLPPELNIPRRRPFDTGLATARFHEMSAGASMARATGASTARGPREKPSRFGSEPSAFMAAGDFVARKSSVRTYTGGPASQCSIDKPDVPPPHPDFLAVFEGGAGLPSWHRKLLPPPPDEAAF